MKKKLIIVIVFFILIVFISIFYKFSLSNTNKINNVKKEIKISIPNEINVGVLHSLTNLYFDYGHSETVGGFEYAFLTDFADENKIKIKPQFADNLAELLVKAQENKIDIILGDVVKAENNPKLLMSSKPINYTTEILVYRKGSLKPNSFSDITGNITVHENSAQSFLLNEEKKKYPDLSWTESKIFTIEELLILLDDQQIDYTIANGHTISLLQRIYPSINAAFIIKENIPKTLALVKNLHPEIIKKLNDHITKSHENGTLAKLEYKYFNAIDSFDYVDTYRFIRAIKDTLPKYRDLFEKYGNINNIDWRLLAAMSYQESHWNPKAKSSTSVRGLMMLTQATAKSLGITNRLNPEQSIKGGTLYLKQLIDRMPSTINENEKIWFALAAYNMGISHLWDARTLATKLDKNPDNWQEVREILPLLSNEKHYKFLPFGFARGIQAKHFVDSIQQYYLSLVGFLLEDEYRQKYLDEKKSDLKKID